jgi:glyoxylase-like metal-dependent hydrolase (beta-lactamase superfamily II)/rhodanese-related sulfurtransferase
VTTPAGTLDFVLFRQFVDEDLGCGSYLVGDLAAGEAVVVDPGFAIEQYLAAAEAEGVRIVRVLETHTHADHLSGHGRFALEHDVPISIHPLAAPEYVFDPLEDGQELRVGSVVIRVVHTPGHRPEHCSFVIDDELVLSGDCLFVGDAARPDLAVEAREGAFDLFASLVRLSALPDGVVVYPGHVAGSLCGSKMSPDHSSTIGREKQTNHALAFSELEAFVLDATSINVPRPPTTASLVALNRGPWVGVRAYPGPVADAASGLVLDTRPLEDFAEAHVPGALHIPLRGGSFGTRTAFLVDPTEPIVLDAGSEEDVHAACRRLWAVGLFHVAGSLNEDWRSETLPTLAAGNARDDDAQLLDVREEGERDVEIPRSLAIPYRLLRGGARGLDPTRPVVTICETGARAAIAASVLARQGYDARAVVGGGVADLTP